MVETRDLIAALSVDAGRPARSLARLWTIAIALAVLVAAVVFFSAIGVRPDFAAAAETIRFLFKFVVTGLLAATALFALLALSRPEGATRFQLTMLFAAPAALAIAVVLELFSIPQAEWGTRLVGTNSLNCLTLVPIIGIGPLGLFILALRNAAPTRPALAGAIAGLAAGGVAATFYAAQCTDDSPLFVATWYPLAIAMLTLVGAAAGRLFARW